MSDFIAITAEVIVAKPNLSLVEFASVRTKHPEHAQSDPSLVMTPLHIYVDSEHLLTKARHHQKNGCGPLRLVESQCLIF